MEFLSNNDLLKICNLTSTNQVVNFLKQNNIICKKDIIQNYVNFLIEKGFIKDFDIYYIDKENNLLIKKYYKNGIFKRKIRESNICFENYSNSVSLNISKEIHYENILKLKSNTDIKNCIDLEKKILLFSPFDGAICSDSRRLMNYLKCAYKINPTILLEDTISKENKTLCSICNKNFVIIPVRQLRYGNNNIHICNECKENKNTTSLIIQNKYKLKIPKKIYKKEYYISKYFDLHCPFCNKKYSSENSFSKHLSRYHGIPIKKYVKEYCYENDENNLCECGNIKGEINYLINLKHYKDLNTLFYDFDLLKDFYVYSRVCKKCTNNDLIVKFKKIYTFFKDKNINYINEIIDEIRNNYHDIKKYENQINMLLSHFRDFSKKEIFNILGKDILCSSSLEVKFLKEVKNNFNIKDILYGREIFKELGFIKYNFENIEHMYIPDFLITSQSGKKYLIEVKSDYILGLKNPALYKRNLTKFDIADKICNNKNIQFYIYLGYNEIIFDKKINKHEIFTLNELKEKFSE